MRSVYWRFSICALLALGSPGLWALDLVQAYRIAQEQDASIRASRATLAAGRERVDQARAVLLPNVSANVGRNYNDLKTTATNILGLESTTRDDYFSHNKSITLRQPVFHLQRLQQYRQSLTLADEALATHEQDIQDLVVRVGSVYMEALLSQEQLTLVQVQKRQYETLVEAARRAFQNGSGTRTDIDEAQARLDMSVAQELEALQNQKYTRRQLELTLNQEVTDMAPLSVTGFERIRAHEKTLQEWTQEALAANPQARALSARLQAAELEIAKAKANYSPTLEAVVQWSDSGNDNVSRLNARYENRIVGLQLNIPIYQGGYVSSVVRQSVAERERVAETLEALRRDLELKVYKEYRSITEGRLKIQALEQAVRSALMALDSTTKSMAAGVRSQLDVLNADQQLAATRRDLAQARFIYLIARLRLHALVGMEPIDNVVDVNRAFGS